MPGTCKRLRLWCCNCVEDPTATQEDRSTSDLAAWHGWARCKLRGGRSSIAMLFSRWQVCRGRNSRKRTGHSSILFRQRELHDDDHTRITTSQNVCVQQQSGSLCPAAICASLRCVKVSIGRTCQFLCVFCSGTGGTKLTLTTVLATMSRHVVRETQ